MSRLVVATKHTRVQAMDERGQGNANHVYLLDCPMIGIPKPQDQIIRFQNGPIKEAGINGCTNEDLLAVIVDRLAGFQAGKFACRENDIVLQKLEEAHFWLIKRTALREARGVEGTNVV